MYIVVDKKIPRILIIFCLEYSTARFTSFMSLKYKSVSDLKNYAVLYNCSITEEIKNQTNCTKQLCWTFSFSYFSSKRQQKTPTRERSARAMKLPHSEKFQPLNLDQGVSGVGQLPQKRRIGTEGRALSSLTAHIVPNTLTPPHTN